MSLFPSPTSPVVQLYVLLVAGWLVLGSAPSAAQIESPAEHADDQRLSFSAQSPPWLAAIGRLHVPGVKYERGYSKHHNEDCSATLVTRRANTPADTIITAWHCLENYRDLSQPITFSLRASPDLRAPVEARRLEDGGDMLADWAILRLTTAIPASSVKALTIHPQRAKPEAPIVMAGYSADAGKGAHGTTLTYDPACTITQQDSISSDSDCRAHKGASGGAVIQLSASGEPWLSGVISQGDGEGYSSYVPVALFRRAIEQHLR